MISQIQILLVDDHELVRNGFKVMIDSQPDMQVTAEVINGEEALLYLRKDPLDIVLMDLGMEGMGGIEATRRILQMEIKTKVIILTAQNKEPFLTQLAEVGAHGYITKGCPAKEFYDAIRTVANGQSYLQKELSQAISPFNKKSVKDSPLEALSPREMEILLMTVEGMSLKEMSNSLSIGVSTISTYKARLFSKLPVKNDVQLTRYAINKGILGNA